MPIGRRHCLDLFTFMSEALHAPGVRGGSCSMHMLNKEQGTVSKEV